MRSLTASHMGNFELKKCPFLPATKSRNAIRGMRSPSASKMADLDPNQHPFSSLAWHRSSLGQVSLLPCCILSKNDSFHLKRQLHVYLSTVGLKFPSNALKAILVHEIELFCYKESHRPYKISLSFIFLDIETNGSLIPINPSRGVAFKIC